CSSSFLPLAGGGDGRFIRNQERKFRARARITLNPDLAAHSMYEAACDGESQSGALLSFASRKTEKIVENFDVKFSRNTRPCVGDAHLYRVWMREILSTTFGTCGQAFRAAFPHVRLSVQPHRPTLGRELESILQQVGNDALE